MLGDHFNPSPFACASGCCDLCHMCLPIMFMFMPHTQTAALKLFFLLRNKLGFFPNQEWKERGNSNWRQMWGIFRWSKKVLLYFGSEKSPKKRVRLNTDQVKPTKINFSVAGWGKDGIFNRPLPGSGLGETSVECVLCFIKSDASQTSLRFFVTAAASSAQGPSWGNIVFSQTWLTLAPAGRDDFRSSWRGAPAALQNGDTHDTELTRWWWMCSEVALWSAMGKKWDVLVSWSGTIRRFSHVSRSLFGSVCCGEGHWEVS